ncbi:MAG: phospho-sugar mutase [Sandaracinaceae bacterium]|nr:phospho-sugar mutase [Sandaracinaceae bacterium]
MLDVLSLRARAEAWWSDDPSPADRDELQALVAKEAWPEIADRFAGRLEFGTAGLRGVLGAGPNRMNLAVVRAAAAGLLAHLLETTPEARERGLVVGCDGRRMSREFANEVVEVAVGAGFRARTFDHVVPTPVVGFACKELGAAAAVMVTASHNPPEYNGYKVYWGNAAQIIPPHDVGIAKAIDAVGSLLAVPRVPYAEALASGRAELVPPSLEDRYHETIQRLVVKPGLRRDLPIAYTALHGVGDQPTRRALATAGFTNVQSVAEQAEPDGAFPTVRFPNPEEAGAMDLVLALATKMGAELVIANDPDADRLALAVRAGEGHDKPGSYVQLTGNEVGCLLGSYLLEHAPYRGERPVVVSSLVSSPMIGAIAEAHGARWEETLTGFKWIANRSLDLIAEGYRFVMGYEEALGYTVSDVVRDKDGVSAALVAADMAAFHASEGRTLLDALDLLARRHGLFLSRQVSVTMKGKDGAAAIAAIMAKVRAKPPTALGAHAVLAVRDLERRQKTWHDGRVEPLAFLSSNVISLELEGGHRVMLRPSGTEPKIKYYFDVRESVGAREHMKSARARGERTLTALVEAFMPLVSEGGA